MLFGRLDPSIKSFNFSKFWKMCGKFKNPLVNKLWTSGPLKKEFNEKTECLDVWTPKNWLDKILNILKNVREIQKSFCMKPLDVQTPQKRLLKNLKLNMTIWSSQAQYDNLKLSSSIWRLDLDVLTNRLPEKKCLYFFRANRSSRAPYDRWHERLAKKCLKKQCWVHLVHHFPSLGYDPRSST